MNKSIIILVIEGDESYTEVNFFLNMNSYVPYSKNDSEIIPSGFAKAIKPEVMQKNIKKLKRVVLNKISNIDDEIIIYAISDGEDDVWARDGHAIRATYNGLKQEIETWMDEYEIENFTIKPLVHYPNMKFEEVLDYDFNGRKPRKHEQDWFDKFCDHFNLRTNISLHKERIKEKFEGTALEELINEILTIL